MYFETVRNGRSRSSKVVDFGSNRKRVCNFLLVINSYLGPILLHFRDTASLLLRTATPPLFDANFGGVPLGLKIVDVGIGSPRSEDSELIILVIIFEVT